MYKETVWRNDTALMRCRICLTTNHCGNITNSSCYLEVFNQLVNDNTRETDSKMIWLCMWCKSILKKVLALRMLAKASEKMLYSQNRINMPDMNEYRHHVPTLTSITHLHIPSVSVETVNLKDENVYKQVEEIGDELNITISSTIFSEEIKINKKSKTKNTNDFDTFLSCNSPLNVNEVKIHNKENIKKIKSKNKIKSKLKEKQFILNSKRNKTGQRKENNQNKVLPDQNKRLLKLDDLKFKVKYLNLEEQLKAMEIKKKKYKDMKYQCDFCGIGFLTNEYLEEHIKRHTKVAGIHKCDICELHFKTSALLSHHRLSHRRVFVCLICDMVISKWSNCYVHRYKCGAPINYVECHVCSKIFSDEYSLKVHLRVHNVKKKFVCEFCSKIFMTKQKMTVHIRTHTGHKPFVCEHCSKSFTTNSNLKSHYLVHSKETKHYCVECDRHYKTAKSLKRHLNESVRHIRETPHRFKCNQCPKQYRTMKMLEVHSIQHFNAAEFTCSECNKIFSNKSNLRKHVKCIHKKAVITE